MTKQIKTGENLGIANQVQGYRVRVAPHPKYKGLYRFKMFGSVWMASEYAFVETSTIYESIEELCVDYKIINALKENKIYTVNALTNLTRHDASCLNGISSESFMELLEKMNELNLHFRY